MIRLLSLLFMMVGLVLPLSVWWLSQRALPPLEGSLPLTELNSPVVVNFDSRAVPYIQAASDGDCYMAQGFITARDRILQMDLLRRQALGELSEVFGPNCLSADKLARTIGFNRLAQAELKSLPPEVKASLEAYARGVNQYVASNLKSLPLEFTLLGYMPKPWQASDSLAIMKYLSYNLDESWKLDDLRQRIFDKVGDPVFRQLFQEDWAGEPIASSNSAERQLAAEIAKLGRQGHHLVNSQPGWGSNAWALSGRLSDSGGSLLACDKHSAYVCPDIWYLCSLKTPGLHVAGATIPGVPGIVIGRNDRIAWGAASLKADVQDLFLEQFSSQFPQQYRTVSGWKDVVEVNEEIPVRFSKNLLHKVRITQHGPLLLQNGLTAVALSWTGSMTDNSVLTSIYKLNRAYNWQDFVAALQDYPGPPQNFVYADQSGNLGYHAAGYCPVRSSKAQGIRFVEGWQKFGQWESAIPFAKLPQGLNPSSDYVVAANQKPVGEKYPWLIGHQWGAPYRASRLASILNGFQKSKRKMGLADLSELELDEYGPLSALVKAEIRQAITHSDLIDRIQLLAVDELEHWDGQMRVNSVAASIYESFITTLGRRLIEPKLGPELTAEYFKLWPRSILLVERYLQTKPDSWLPPEERTHPAFILTTFSQSLKNLRIAFGTDDQAKWLWQSVHRVVFKHVLDQGMPGLSFLMNVGPIGIGGDSMTVNTNNVNFSWEPGQFPCDSGPTLRTLIDMSDRDKFYQSTCLGQSGQLFSPFYRDQLPSWLKVDPRPLAFSDKQVDYQMQHKLVLSNH